MDIFQERLRFISNYLFILIVSSAVLISVFNVSAKTLEDRDATLNQKSEKILSERGRFRRDLSSSLNNFLDILNYDKLDVVFILDRSTGVNQNNFLTREKVLLESLTKYFFTIAPDKVRLAALTFAKDITVSFNHLSPNFQILKCDLIEKRPIFDSLRFNPDSDTAHGNNVHDALQMAKQILSNSRQERQGVKQVVFVMTDGEHENVNDVHVMVQQLRNDNVILFAVGVGAWLTENKVTPIATDASHFAKVDDWFTAIGPTLNPKASQEMQKRANLPSEYVLYQRSSLTCGQNSAAYCNVITGYSSCQCKPGFALENAVCLPCGRGTYKPLSGPQTCTVCPQKSDSNEGSDSITNCSCNDGQCSSDNDPCSGVNCGNNAQCVLGADGYTTTCDCRPGYSGSNCADEISACASNPCYNGGVCFNGGDDFLCVCQFGYRGRQCQEEINECEIATCLGRAECRQEVNNMECFCLDGYRGVNCDVGSTTRYRTIFSTTTTTRSSSTSHSSAGSSTRTSTSPKSFTTTSSIEYSRTSIKTTAPDPTQEDLTTDQKLLMHVILPAVLGFIVLLVIMVVCIICCRRKRNTNGSTNASYTTDTSLIKSNKDFMLPFDSNIYINEGTPNAPKPVDFFHERSDNAEYGNEPLHRGMEEWVDYTMSAMESDMLTRFALVRIDGDKWVLTPGCHLNRQEIEITHSILTRKLNNVTIPFQGDDFGVISNSEQVLVAHSRDSNQKQEMLCATKTRQFVIICLAEFANDRGRCRQEIIRLGEYIRSQGL